MKSKVLDLSAWNDVKSYNTLKNDGTDAVILKAMRKDLNYDKGFKKHLNGCKKEKLDVIGSYHYTYATSINDAKICCNKWLGLIGNSIDTYILDWEDAILPKNLQGINIINTYADMILNAGHKFAIYTGLSMYKTCLLPYKDKLPYDFWIARYYEPSTVFKIKDTVNESFTPNIAHNLIGWQYTSNAKSNGCGSKLDCSIWYKDIKVTCSKNNFAYNNPFTEPVGNVQLGSVGNSADWVLWCLWRFGLLLNSQGVPDSVMINNVISKDDVEKIKIAQRSLGLKDDGIVGKQTKAVFRKFC